MPKFTYEAKPEPHRIVRGEIEAVNEQDALHKLSQLGIFVISLRAQVDSMRDQRGLFAPRVSNRDLVLFTRQFASLLEAGVTIMQSLTVVMPQVKNKNLRVLVQDVADKVKDGAPLSDSFAHYPRVFPPLYTALVRAGEASGSIYKSLVRLADFLEEQEEFRSSLLSNLIYPAFVFLVGLGTILVLLIFVIPRLVEMFADMGQVLPLPTVVLINLSQGLRHWLWLLIGGGCCLFFLLVRLQGTPRGRRFIDAVKLRIPLLGGMASKTEIARIMRIISLLVSSGIPITAAFDIATDVAQNSLFKEELRGFRERISGGSSIADCFRASRLFPEFVMSILTVGEETGKFDQACMRIAKDFEKDVDRATKVLLRMLEPVVILVLGLVVGFIVISMLLPIFQLNLMVR